MPMVTASCELDVIPLSMRRLMADELEDERRTAREEYEQLLERSASSAHEEYVQAWRHADRRQHGPVAVPKLLERSSSAGRSASSGRDEAVHEEYEQLDRSAASDGGAACGASGRGEPVFLLLAPGWQKRRPQACASGHDEPLVYLPLAPEQALPSRAAASAMPPLSADALASEHRKRAAKRQQQAHALSAKHEKQRLSTRQKLRQAASERAAAREADRVQAVRKLQREAEASQAQAQVEGSHTAQRAPPHSPLHLCTLLTGSAALHVCASGASQAGGTRRGRSQGCA
jgi:hypothetical protein